MFPVEWKDADFSDKEVRLAFADFLEERGDWRAEEVRRLWIQKGTCHWIIRSGPWMLGFTQGKDFAETVLKAKMMHLFNNSDFSPEDWRNIR